MHQQHICMCVNKGSAASACWHQWYSGSLKEVEVILCDQGKGLLGFSWWPWPKDCTGLWSCRPLYPPHGSLKTFLYSCACCKLSVTPAITYPSLSSLQTFSLNVAICSWWIHSMIYQAWTSRKSKTEICERSFLQAKPMKLNAKSPPGRVFLYKRK